MKNNSKINISIKDILATIIFIAAFAIIFYSDYFIQLSLSSNSAIEETRIVSKKISELTQAIDKISLNTDVLRSGFLKDVLVLPESRLNTEGNFIYGKSNPFSGALIVVATSSNQQGGIRYTGQTSTTSIIVVPNR